MSPARKLGYIGLGVILTGVVYYLARHGNMADFWIFISICSVGMFLCGRAVQKSDKDR